MKTLAIDTALGACSVAIMSDNAVLSCHHEKRLRGHAEQLLPMTETALAEAGLAYADLDLLAVTVGPGTFTGLRIGLAAIRAISVATKIPAVGVTTLEALAASVQAIAPSEMPLFVAIDARRKEVFLQKFDISTDKSPKALSNARSVSVSDFKICIDSVPALITGSGIEYIEQHIILSNEGISIFEMDPDPDPVVIARLATEKYRKNPSDTPPVPVYLRAPDAKLPGGILPPESVA
jgi:tRNA threonylcarbamoyladenosine biosynthesis protein TsaB